MRCVTKSLLSSLKFWAVSSEGSFGGSASFPTTVQALLLILPFHIYNSEHIWLVNCDLHHGL